MKRLFLVRAYSRVTKGGLTVRDKIAHRMLIQVPEDEAYPTDPKEYITRAQQWLLKEHCCESHAYDWECRYIGSDATPIIRL